MITYPTARELAESTLAYAVGKKRYFAELRSALPILIAIGLKQRPKTSEIEEFRSAFRLLDWEEERRIEKTTAEMLKGFENDRAVAAARKRIQRGSRKLKRLLIGILMDSMRLEYLSDEDGKISEC